MKSKPFLMVAVCSAILAGCDNSLDLTDPIKPIPVVYGMICPSDAVHKILVMKTFISDGSLTYDAHQPGNLYFKEAYVNLEVRSAEGDVLERYPFGPEEFPERDAGMFAVKPNILYANRTIASDNPFLFVINPTITLTAYIPEIGESVLATSRIPPPVYLKSPARMDPFPLSLFTEQAIRFVWSKPSWYDVELVSRVNYEEEIDGEWIPVSVLHKRWFLHGGLSHSMDIEWGFNSEWFYPMVAGKIEKKPEVTSRKFLSVDFIFNSTIPEYYDFLSYVQFVTDFTQVNFTNISNGLGFFSIYNRTELKGFTLDQQSLDSLCNGKLTRDLKFIRW